MIENIVGLNTDQVAQFYPLPIKAPVVQQAPFTAEHFTIRNLPHLGYVDYRGYSHYVSRVPSRQNVQGYNRSNTTIQANPEGNTPNWDALTQTVGLRDMLTGKYRKFGTIFDEVIESDVPIKRAVSLTSALSVDDMETLDLEYRGMKVARCNNPKKYGPLFRLPKKFHYLKEEFEENGIRIEL